MNILVCCPLFVLFYKQHFQMHFPGWQFLYFDSNFTGLSLRVHLNATKKQELSYYQLCVQWYHHRLSVWQHLVPPVRTQNEHCDDSQFSVLYALVILGKKFCSFLKTSQINHANLPQMIGVLLSVMYSLGEKFCSFLKPPKIIMMTSHK